MPSIMYKVSAGRSCVEAEADVEKDQHTKREGEGQGEGDGKRELPRGRIRRRGE